MIQTIILIFISIHAIKNVDQDAEPDAATIIDPHLNRIDNSGNLPMKSSSINITDNGKLDITNLNRFVIIAKKTVESNNKRDYYVFLVLRMPSHEQTESKISVCVIPLTTKTSEKNKNVQKDHIFNLLKKQLKESKTTSTFQIK